ncbi:PREDICTED: 28S ribosomal protein S22, mitochondrial isoform X1 [Papilio xuthus]|uniref:28S ribosomal protein S22, mitochondrial isoform X1 n=1 Tax=Papilio xuthus TaxID=66420 RepID=A0AAJ6ZW75_PAPXU|nr:PREDICTED: 28S ribosomal protein S22, mitochondrial isoform X1 [Papilio xuthus]
MSLHKFIHKNVVLQYNHFQLLAISSRKLSIIPSVYDGEQDPGPKFFSSGVQALLKRLTRPDFSKVFRKRTNSNRPVLKTPEYKFLTNEELQSEFSKANKTAARLLQMPPVVKVHQPINEVLSKDPALVGYDNTKYLFTDITFGVPNEDRLIVERDPDGTLQMCDHDTRKRLNQIYFPIQGRKVREPMMFADEEKLNGLLEAEKYEYILDRACIQYEPDELSYQKVTSITYQHVDMKTNYKLLRSTRHFGPLAFYLTWHQSMDNLMLELLQTGVIREAVLLMGLRQAIHEDIAFASDLNALVHQVLPMPVQASKPDSLSEVDIQLDNQCIDCVVKYIAKNSAMKSQQELALQGFREDYQQMVELSRGLRKAHGEA